MQESAQRQITTIQSVAGIYRKFPSEALDPIIRAYQSMGKNISAIQDDIIAGIQLMQEEKRKEAFETARLNTQKTESDKAYTATWKRLLKERDEADRAQIQASRMRQRETDEVNAAHAVALKMRSKETAAAYAAEAEMAFTKEQEREALLWGEGGGMLGSLTKRLAFYAAIGLAIRGVTATLQDAIAIERESAQTGFGVQGIQELRYAAGQSLVPIEAVTTAIARMQQKIEGADGGAVQSFQVLGLTLSEVAKIAENDPLEAFNKVVDAIGKLKDQGQAALVIGDLFGKGSSSAQMREFFTEYAALRKKAHDEGVVLTTQEIADIASLGRAWETTKAKMEAYFGSAISRGVQASSSKNLVGRVVGGTLGFGLGGAAGALAGAPTGIGAIPGAGIGAVAVGAAGEIKGAEAEQALKDLFTGKIPNPAVSGPRALGPAQTARSMGTTRQGNAEFSIAESTSALLTKTANQKIAEELRAERAAEVERKRAEAKALREAKEEASILSMISALNELGVAGRLNAVKMERALDEVWKGFEKGWVSIQELTEATSNYFSMIEDNVARPGLKEAIRMFEQGLIGEGELLHARERSDAFSRRGNVEDAFTRGSASPSDLLNAQRSYHRSIIESAPDRFMSPQVLFGSGGQSQSRIINRLEPSAGVGGSINVIPLDQFSDQMLRRWKQQGLQPR